MTISRPRAAGVVAIVLCLSLIVGGQALAWVSAPSATRLSQTKVMGDTGFAYLAGLRLVAAGLLNRQLEVQYHQYVTGKTIAERTDLLPAVRLIQALNPQLEEPYYYTSYVLSRRGDWKGALDLAQEGIRNNSTSGLLRANYVQLLLIQDKTRNLPVAVAQMRAALRPGMVYATAQDRYEAYSVFRAVCRLSGDTRLDAALADEQKRMTLDTESGPPAQSSGLGGLLDAWQNSAMPTEHE